MPGFEVEAPDGFEHREACILDTPLRSFELPFNQLAFRQPQQIGWIVTALLRTGGCHTGIITHEGR